MHRFWDSMLEPLLEITRPRVIVEVGSAQGANTRNLLGFCERTGARLHVVDPMPRYDVAEWRRRHAGCATFHLARSPRALAGIEPFDAILIDGDHNWYTLYHELTLVEDRCESEGWPFPLVVLHDTGWPYGRRDCYYEPERIPPEERQPYERKGMRPGVRSLVEDGGMNRGFANATIEGEPRSGVLTAIEDYIKETAAAFRLVTVTGMHGLAVLVPEHLFGNRELTRFLDSLEPSPALQRHLERMELTYLEAEIARQDLAAALRRSEVRHKKQMENLRRRFREGSVRDA